MRSVPGRVCEMVPYLEEHLKSIFLAGTGSLSVKTLAIVILTFIQAENLGYELLCNVSSEPTLDPVRVSMDWNWRIWLNDWTSSSGR